MTATRLGCRRPGIGEAGFTLVELIVTLALIALLTALLPNAIGLGRRAWETQADADRRIAELSRLALVAQRLAEAMPHFEAERPGLAAIAFRGTPEAAAFVATGPGSDGRGGLWRWRIGSSGQSYRVEARPLYGDGGGTFAFEAAGSLTLTYFGRARPNAAAEWHATWERTDALPSLVALTVQPSSADGVAQARRMIIALRLSGP